MQWCAPVLDGSSDAIDGGVMSESAAAPAPAPFPAPHLAAALPDTCLDNLRTRWRALESILVEAIGMG